jgi:hypothetical protein
MLRRACTGVRSTTSNALRHKGGYRDSFQWMKAIKEERAKLFDAAEDGGAGAAGASFFNRYPLGVIGAGMATGLVGYTVLCHNIDEAPPRSARRHGRTDSDEGDRYEGFNPHLRDSQQSVTTLAQEGFIPLSDKTLIGGRVAKVAGQRSQDMELNPNAPAHQYVPGDHGFIDRRPWDSDPIHLSKDEYLSRPHVRGDAWSPSIFGMKEATRYGGRKDTFVLPPAYPEADDEVNSA